MELISLTRDKITGRLRFHAEGDGHEVIIEENTFGYNVMSLKGEMTNEQIKPFVTSAERVKQALIEENNLTSGTNPPQLGV